MDYQLTKQLLQFITKVAAHEGTTISEIMKGQDHSTIPAKNDIISTHNTQLDQLLQELSENTDRVEEENTGEKGLKYYEGLLSNLKPQKAPNIPYINLDEGEESKPL